MNKIIMTFIFLSALAAMAAAEPEKNDGPDIQEESIQSVPAIAPELHDISPRDKNWPRPFIPSEKIGADSVVSFPADI
jgi:hypothetical protein